MKKSTRKPRSRKAAWHIHQGRFIIPRPKGPPLRRGERFPLSPHGSGKWQKKIGSTVHYFGTWATRVRGDLTPVPDWGWKEALAEFRRQEADLRAGRTRRESGAGLTVKDLGDRFLTAKMNRVASGEISPRTFSELKNTCQFLADAFGKDRRVDDLAADDFETLRARMAERWGAHRLGNEIGRVRSVLRYAADNRLIDRPVHFGPGFKKPGKAVFRRLRATNGGRMLEADEIRRLLDAAAGKPVTFRDLKTGEAKTVTLPARADVHAMLLLMVNAGFGPMDLATLPESGVDLDGGIVGYARPKTGIERRCPLWAESVAALRAWFAVRPERRAADAAGLVFVTARGRKCISASTANPIVIVIGNLMRAVGVHRRGLGAYSMRHVFRTVADEIPDRPAIDLIMGHSDGSMAAVYRERIAPARLQAVTGHVRAWLFPVNDPTAGEKAEGRAA